MDALPIGFGASLKWTWTFPNGRTFTGYAYGSDLASALDVRYPSSIPAGDHLLKITADASSNVVLWVQYH
jgi:hypothetical protein